MQNDTKLEDRDTDDLCRCRVDERAFMSMAVPLMSLSVTNPVPMPMGRRLHLLELTWVALLDVHILCIAPLLDDRILRRAGRALDERLVVETRPVREGHAAVVGLQAVAMRVVRDAQAPQLRAAPAEGSDLDDEDEEYADQGYCECIWLRSV